MRRSLVLCVLAFAACSSNTPASSGSGSTSSSSSSGAAATGTSSSGSSALSSSSSGSTSGSGSSSGSSSGSTSGSSGSAPLLRFAFTGDTRPDNCDDVTNYPGPVVDNIVAGMKNHDVQLALDTGDHLKVCGSDSTTVATAAADAQMQIYSASIAALDAPFYLAMGNHECFDNSSLCSAGDPVLTVFQRYQGTDGGTPYFTFDRATPSGTASFVFIADTAWDATESAWLDATLTRTDASAYTIIAKHVPSTNVTDFPTNADEMTVINAHRYALLLDGHAHTYVHADGGREITLGLGGAPLDHPSRDAFGFGLAEQLPDGRLQVTIYDAASDSPIDQFMVSGN